MRCSVALCNNNNKTKRNEFMFFRFPQDSSLQKAWLNAGKCRDDINIKNARVCSKHFSEESYKRNLKRELMGCSAKNRRLLKADAVPTLDLPSSKPEVNDEGKERLTRKNKIKLVKEETLDSQVECFSEPEDVLTSVPDVRRDTGVNTDPVDLDNTIWQLKDEIERLRKENRVFQKIFTPNQLKKLRNPLKRITWTAEDISRAMAIYTAGAGAYRFLLETGYPLPETYMLKKLTKS